MNDGMGWLAGFCAVLVVIIMVIAGVSQGIMFVGHGVATALGLVSWAEVGEFLQQLVLAILIMVLVVFGLLVGIFAWLAYITEKAEAERQEDRRRHHEVSKPRIPADLTYAEREGLRNFNAVIRPDFDDLEKLRNSD